MGCAAGREEMFNAQVWGAEEQGKGVVVGTGHWNIEEGRLRHKKGNRDFQKSPYIQSKNKRPSKKKGGRHLLTNWGMTFHAESGVGLTESVVVVNFWVPVLERTTRKESWEGGKSPSERG